MKRIWPLAACLGLLVACHQQQNVRREVWPPSESEPAQPTVAEAPPPPPKVLDPVIVEVTDKSTVGQVRRQLDKGNPDKDAVQASRDLLQFLGVTVEEPDEARVSDRFACFAETWERDLRPEIQDYDSLVTEARTQRGLRGEAGKPLIARYIARKLTSAEPPVVPPTVKEMVEKAVAVAYSGTCLHAAKPAGEAKTGAGAQSTRP